MSTRADSATLVPCVCPRGSTRRLSVFTPLTPLPASKLPLRHGSDAAPGGRADGDCSAPEAFRSRVHRPPPCERSVPNLKLDSTRIDARTLFYEETLRR